MIISLGAAEGCALPVEDVYMDLYKPQQRRMIDDAESDASGSIDTVCLSHAKRKPE